MAVVALRSITISISKKESNNNKTHRTRLEPLSSLSFGGMVVVVVCLFIVVVRCYGGGWRYVVWVVRSLFKCKKKSVWYIKERKEKKNTHQGLETRLSPPFVVIVGCQGENSPNLIKKCVSKITKEWKKKLTKPEDSSKPSFGPFHARCRASSLLG